MGIEYRLAGLEDEQSSEPESADEAQPCGRVRGPRESWRA